MICSWESYQGNLQSRVLLLYRDDDAVLYSPANLVIDTDFLHPLYFLGRNWIFSKNTTHQKKPSPCTSRLSTNQQLNFTRSTAENLTLLPPESSREKATDIVWPLILCSHFLNLTAGWQRQATWLHFIFRLQMFYSTWDFFLFLLFVSSPNLTFTFRITRR